MSSPKLQQKSAPVEMPVNGSDHSGGLHVSEPPRPPMPDVSAIEAVMAQMPGPSRPTVEEDFDFDLMEAKAPAEVLVEPPPDMESVQIRKPSGKEFVYVHPAWRMELFMLVPEEVQGKPQVFKYAVAPSVAERFPEFCRRVEMVPCADRNGGLFLWPVLLESPVTAEISKFSTSLRARMRQGAGQWCRYRCDQPRERYDLYRASVQRDSPQWPDGGIREMVKAAFRNGRIITEASAQTLRERIGELVPE
jgi:hypothetical protein